MPTTDFAARTLANQVPVITGVVKDIARITIDDGLRFDADSARGETTREDDLYSGVRVHLGCHLATAHTRLEIDVNVGDPISPAAQRVNVPRLLHPADTIDLLGYPLHMVHAEKIVTAIQRGTVNTRWRDFADIYLPCRSQPVDGRLLHDALTMVAGHRRAVLAPLADVLAGYADAPGVQAKWAAWRRKQQFDNRLPEAFADVLKKVLTFADPAITSAAGNAQWRPQNLAWLLDDARCGGPASGTYHLQIGTANLAANRADLGESGRMGPSAIMPLTCGDARQRTSPDVLWPLF